MDILTEGGGILLERDYTLLIDTSEIMLTEFLTSEGERSFWDVVKQVTIILAKKCEEFDFDGLTLYLYADDFERFERVTVAEIANIFPRKKPWGKAKLALGLKDAIDNYFQRRRQGLTKANGETIVVITASLPEDEARVKEIIIEASQQMAENEELGITFIQIGTDSGLSKFLQFLDDNLTKMGAKFDICDTVKIENLDEKILSEMLSEVLLHAITD